MEVHILEWIHILGEGLDARLRVQVLDWGLSAGGCLGPGWGSGVQVTGGDPGRDLGPRGVWVTGGGLGGVWIVDFHIPEWGLVLIGGFRS